MGKMKMKKIKIKTIKKQKVKRILRWGVFFFFLYEENVNLQSHEFLI